MSRKKARLTDCNNSHYIQWFNLYENKLTTLTKKFGRGSSVEYLDNYYNLKERYVIKYSTIFKSQFDPRTKGSANVITLAEPLYLTKYLTYEYSESFSLYAAEEPFKYNTLLYKPCVEISLLNFFIYRIFG
jgi:hypothetical protein